MRNPGNKRRSVAGFGLAAAVAALAALGTAVPASAAEGVIVDATSADAISGSYIVVLKNGTSVADTAKSVTSKHGGTVKRTFGSVHGFSGAMTELQAKRAAADPSVAYVEQDKVVHASTDQLNPPSWGQDRVDQRNLPLDQKYSYSTTASNVHAYIIDTGINMTHSTFGGRAVSGYDFVDNKPDATDCNGHGTHVAGTVGGSEYGLAKGVSLTAVRVLDCNGSGSTTGVVSGIDWVTTNAIKPAVANMSLGGGVSTTLDSAVQRSIAAGVTYGVAAGNDNGADACNSSPARTPEAITVGATTSTDARATYSNIGRCLDIFAPGSGIKSSWIGSTTATNTISGTSMATPHVVGAAALYLATNPTATPQQVRDALVTNGTPGKVTDPGAASPNVLLYTGAGGTPPPPPPPSGCATVTNSTRVAIPDNGPAITSPVTVANCPGNASATSKVAVTITHTYIGDLVIDLVAPDGTSTRLKSSSNDSTANLNTTYTVNLSSKVANGVWKLKVQDVVAVDSGTLDTWSLSV